MVQKAKAKAVQLSEVFFGVPLIFILGFVSIVAWYVSYTTNLALTYNDSMSHVNIARLVIDNQEPGLSQLGTVWLPLNHVLPLVFIWNDWFWRTGMANSIFSMASYIIAAAAIYQTVSLLTKKRIAGLIAALAFATNLNILYLQTTPLTEPLYVALFSLSMLFFTMYLLNRKNARYLLFLGFTGFLQVITRYDGWFVVAIIGGLIGINEYFFKRHTIKECLGKLLLYGLPVGLGIVLWFLWNGLIFGDPLYFATAPYSAQVQQNIIAEETGLLTEGSWYYSVKAYWYAMLHNVGTYAAILAAFGAAVFFFFSKATVSNAKKGLIILLLLSPIIFNVIALFLGFSTINVPEVHLSTADSPTEQWFNVRYGILALPFIAVLIGMFASWRKLAVIIAVEVILIQAFVFYSTDVITITDGTIGSSAFRQHAVAKTLSDSVKPDDTVLMSFSYFSPLAFKSELSLKQFIHEGVSKKWDNALKTPSAYTEFVVMSSVNDYDPVRRSLIVGKNDAFLKSYTEIYRDGTTVIYQINKDRTNTAIGYESMRRGL